MEVVPGTDRYEFGTSLAPGEYWYQVDARDPSGNDISEYRTFVVESDWQSISFFAENCLLVVFCIEVC